MSVTLETNSSYSMLVSAIKSGEYEIYQTLSRSFAVAGLVTAAVGIIPLGLGIAKSVVTSPLLPEEPAVAGGLILIGVGMGLFYLSNKVSDYCARQLEELQRQPTQAQEIPAAPSRRITRSMTRRNIVT